MEKLVQIDNIQTNTFDLGKNSENWSRGTFVQLKERKKLR